MRFSMQEVSAQRSRICREFRISRDRLVCLSVIITVWIWVWSNFSISYLSLGTLVTWTLFRAPTPKSHALVNHTLRGGASTAEALNTSTWCSLSFKGTKTNTTNNPFSTVWYQRLTEAWTMMMNFFSHVRNSFICSLFQVRPQIISVLEILKIIRRSNIFPDTKERVHMYIFICTCMYVYKNNSNMAHAPKERVIFVYMPSPLRGFSASSSWTRACHCVCVYVGMHVCILASMYVCIYATAITRIVS